MNFVEGEAPQPNDLEVSLFGTGVGECIAVHLGLGEWMLVDSCRAGGATPVNLAYLKSIGVNFSTDVKLIVATHWHDDHVDGLGELVSQCSSATLVFSNALESDEYRKIIGLFYDQDITFDREKSGVREIGDCFRALLSRKASGSKSYKPVMTQADHHIYRNSHCNVIALSPSPSSLINAFAEVSEMWHALENEADRKDGPRPARAGIPSPDRNHNAVALWVKMGERRILLGADLEEAGNPEIGWQAVLTCNQFPDGKAHVFKIPHHGSPNGDYGPVWNSIVESGALAILTSYNRGTTPRPTTSDIERIQNEASSIYFTSLPSKTLNQYDRTVERTLKSVVRRRTSLKPKGGHIQIRWLVDGSVSVRTAGAAGKI